MKKALIIFSLLSLAVLLIEPSAIAQDYKSKNVIKTGLFSPIIHCYILDYERALGQSTSAQLGFFYLDWKTSGTGWSGFALTPEFRYYLSSSKPAPNGFFVAPFLRYSNYNLTGENNATGTLSTMGGGLVIGVQQLFKDRISLEAFIGPSYSSGSVKVDTGSESDLSIGGSFDGFSVRANITIGVAF